MNSDSTELLLPCYVEKNVLVVCLHLINDNFLRPGYQCRSDRVGPDSRCCDFCWRQVYSGHRSHPGVPCKNIEINLTLRHHRCLIVITFVLVRQQAIYL